MSLSITVPRWSSGPYLFKGSSEIFKSVLYISSEFRDPLFWYHKLFLGGTFICHMWKRLPRLGNDLFRYHIFKWRILAATIWQLPYLKYTSGKDAKICPKAWQLCLSKLTVYRMQENFLYLSSSTITWVGNRLWRYSETLGKSFVLVSVQVGTHPTELTRHLTGDAEHPTVRAPEVEHETQALLRRSSSKSRLSQRMGHLNIPGDLLTWINGFSIQNSTEPKTWAWKAVCLNDVFQVILENTDTFRTYDHPDLRTSSPQWASKNSPRARLAAWIFCRTCGRVKCPETSYYHRGLCVIQIWLAFLRSASCSWVGCSL